MIKCEISIIIPVYNTEKYLKEALDSLYNQTFTDFEVIFIDDGSTDNSASIIKDYINHNDIKNMMYIYQDNAGPSVARNKGLEIKNGKYVCFMDSDDKLPQNALSLMHSKIIEKDADIVIGGTYRFNEDREWKINSHFLSEGYKDIVNCKELIWTMGPCNKMFKSELIDSIRFPINLSNGEDQCFVMESYLKANKIYTIDELVYYYRERDIEDGSLTSELITKPKKVLQQAVIILDTISKIIDVYVDNPLTNKAVKEIYINRMININIWGPLKQAIDSKDSKTQIECLEYLFKIIKLIDIDVFNNLFTMHRLCTAWIIDRYLALSKDARKLYLEIVKYLFDNLYNKSYVKLAKKYKILTPTLKRVSCKSEIEGLMIIRQYLFNRKLKKLKKVKIEKLKVSLRNPVLRFGGIVRKIDKNKVILASNKSETISDNLNFIETSLLKTKKDIVIKSYPKKNRNLYETISMYWDFSNAKNILLDDYYNNLYGARLHKNINVIQLWHACGAFKKFGFSAISQSGGNELSFEEKAHSAYTHIFTSSDDIIPEYKDAFGVKDNKVSVMGIGVPRTDVFFDENYISHIKKTMKNKIRLFEDKKIIAYAPTFRVNSSGGKVFDFKIDCEYWCEHIPDNYILAIKLHPSVSKKINIPKEYSNKIIDVSKTVNIQDLLMVSDILITDYSSVIFEYALMNKPMVFFAYDLESYIDERDFYYKYEDLVPGTIVKNTEELVNAIMAEKYDAKKLEVFKNKFLKNIDGKSTDRIINFMFSN